MEVLMTDNPEELKERKGIVYLQVALYLEADADDDEIQDIVSEMDYSFTHPMISDTEVQGIL